MESRKQAVSIRMNVADVRKVKRLAQRLGARDSDVIRFAVKLMLGKLAPLSDPDGRGRTLLPVFVESGAELLRFFELDAARLEAIINDGVEPLKRVDREDIALLALSGGSQRYAELRLSGLTRPDRVEPEPSEPSESLRAYLYDKYVYRSLGEALGAEPLTPIRMTGAQK
jgi:Arc/MetJ-type ribon-helix-helix transcriptional regulator